MQPVITNGGDTQRLDNLSKHASQPANQQKLIFDEELIQKLRTQVLNCQDLPMDNQVSCECECTGSFDDVVSCCRLFCGF